MTHYQYGRYIAGVYRAFQQFLKFRLAETDLRPLEFRVLLYLIHHDGANQEELADWLCVDKSVVARMVKRMVANSYVTRRVNEQDRRAYQLFRTERAIAYEPEMVEILEEWEGIILEKVPADERDHFSELMRGVFQHTRMTVQELDRRMK